MNQVIDNVPIWLSIIAINMTVIGLTSLAERKTIIGVDYSKYLLKKYKVFGLVRMFVLLIVFALINIVSLFVMFTGWTILKSIFFFLLCASLVFAIYYFFGFILVENKQIRREICYSEILGLYYYQSERSYGSDPWYDYLLEGMPAKKSWNQSLSSNVIAYFDIFNSDTINDFVQIFGPDSILYPQTRKDKTRIERYYEKHFFVSSDDPDLMGKPEIPADYTTNRDGRIGKYISREFLDFIKESRIPDRWIGEIFRLFNDANKDVDPDVNGLNFCVIMRCVAVDMYHLTPYLAQAHVVKMLYDQMLLAYSSSAVRNHFIDEYFFIFLIHSLSENKDTTFKRFAENYMIKYISNDKPSNINRFAMLKMVIDWQLEYGDKESLSSVLRVAHDYYGSLPLSSGIDSHLQAPKYSLFVQEYKKRYLA